MYSRVNSNLLEDRLDAEFYSLEQIKNHKTLQDYGVIPLSAYCNGINVGYTGELTSVYRAQGTTLFAFPISTVFFLAMTMLIMSQMILQPITLKYGFEITI